MEIILFISYSPGRPRVCFVCSYNILKTVIFAYKTNKTNKIWSNKIQQNLTEIKTYQGCLITFYKFYR